MRIYLDTSVYNRPFDDQVQPRIWLETSSLVVILQMVQAGEIQLVGSSVLTYENSQNPFLERRQWIHACLRLVICYQRVDDAIRQRAQELEKEGLKAVDALHGACAEQAGTEYFLTCDDRLIRKFKGAMKVINPIEFVLRVTGERTYDDTSDE
jgi:predicted nucleic acid-binding protein